MTKRQRELLSDLLFIAVILFIIIGASIPALFLLSFPLIKP